MRLVFDTVSSISIISYTQVEKHGFKIIPSTINIVSADGNVSQIMGLTEPLKVKVADRIVEMNLAVLKNQHNDVLLGEEWFGATDAGIYPSKGLLHMDDRYYHLSQGEKEKEQEEVVFEVSEEIEFEESPDCFDLDGKKIKPPEGLTKEQKAIFRGIGCIRS